MKTVLAPVDFSSVTNRVIAAAIALARLLKGRIILLHVMSPPSAVRNVLPAVEDAELHAKAVGHATQKKLRELERAHRRKFRAIESTQSFGEPGATIARIAKESKAAYIVIASHGHSAARAALIGSAAQHVINHAPCPVLIVPPLPQVARPAK